MFVNTLRTWRNVLTKPSERTFDAERNKPSATLLTAMTWIVLVSAASLLLNNLETAMVDGWVIPPEIRAEYTQSEFTERVSRSLFRIRVSRLNWAIDIAEFYGRLWASSDILYNSVVAVFGPLSYFVLSLSEERGKLVYEVLDRLISLVNVFVYHVIAVALGGRGKLGRYAFLLAAIGAPIVLLNALLDFVPLVSGMAVAALPGTSDAAARHWATTLQLPFDPLVTCTLFVYGLILVYLATKTEHGLPGWKTIVAVAISWLLTTVVNHAFPYGPWSMIIAAGMLK